MADQPPKAGSRLKGPALAAYVVACVAAVTPHLTQPNEGYVGHAYKDATGTATFCYGETQHVDPMRVYSKDQCGVMLRARMAKDYGPLLIKCVPAFADPQRAHAFQASLDAAYNTGAGGFCRSSIAKLFNAGRWTDGCNAIVGWRDTSKGRRLPGLVRRRKEEAHWCFTGRLK